MVSVYWHAANDADLDQVQLNMSVVTFSLRWFLVLANDSRFSLLNLVSTGCPVVLQQNIYLLLFYYNGRVLRSAPSDINFGREVSRPSSYWTSSLLFLFFLWLPVVYVTIMNYILDDTRLSSRSQDCTWRTSRRTSGPLGYLDYTGLAA